MPDAPATQALDPVAQIATLSAQLERVAQLLAAETNTPGLGSAESALQRLIMGRPQPNDLALLGMSVAGARLAVVEVSDQRIREQLHRELRSSSGQVVTRQRDRVMVLLRGLPRRSDDDRSRRSAALLAMTILRAAPAASVGVSAPLPDAAALPAAYAEATEAAALAAAMPERWACADDHWATVSARRLARGLADCLTVANPLQRLRDYDDKHECNLVGTVAAWLTSNCDTAKAASQLSLHPNTLRYRLRRASIVSGLDLSDPNARLLAQLAFA